MAVRDATFTVPSGPAREDGYSIHLGAGLTGDLAADLVRSPVGARYALVTDRTVHTLHAARLAGRLRAAGLVVDEISFEPGESSKTRTTLARIIDRMVELGLGRDAAVVAVGGGVVGDLAGFAASIYHRGIPVVQVPTTLLAMVDSSIGGKTGHDVPGGKNLVGSFHPPAAVWSDLAFLDTLPLEELRAGFAEVIKHGAIADAGMLAELEADGQSLLRREPSALRRAVGRSIEIKVEAVSEDPGETGRRAALNFGHTVGHAVEAASAYMVRHGEAVAMGMAAEARLSARRGLLAPDSARRLTRLIEAFGLPVRIPPGLSTEAIWEAARRDKKARSGRVHCILLASLGTVARCPEGGWSAPVERAELLEALADPEPVP